MFVSHNGCSISSELFLKLVMVQDYLKERQGDPSTRPPPPNPLMMGLDAGGYVLKAVGSVKVLVSSCVLLWQHSELI